MQIAVGKTAVTEFGILLGAGLSLALVVTLAAYLLDPVLVPFAIMVVMAGGLLLFRPEVGIYILLASVVFKYPESMERLGGVGLENIVRVVLSVILLATCVLRRNFDFLRSRQVQLLAVIAVIIAVNWFLVGRIDPPAYLTPLDQSTRSLQRAVLQLVFVVFLVAFIRTPRPLALVTWFLIFAVFVTAAGAVSPTFAAMTDAGGRAAEGRAAATFGIQAAENSNRLAFLCLIAIPIIWFRMMASRSRLGRLAGSVGILALVLGVTLSGSRSGLVNLALLPVLLFMQSRQKGRQGAVILIVSLLAIGLAAAVVPQPVLDRLGTLLPSEGAGGDPAESTHRRWLVFWEGLKLFWQDPLLGVGVGNFRWRAFMDPSYGVGGATHNAYLLVLVEGGVILLVAHLLLFWQTYRDLGRVEKGAGAPRRLGLDWLVSATRTNIVLLAVFSLFAEAWKEFYYPLLIGTAAVLAQLHRAPPGRS